MTLPLATTPPRPQPGPLNSPAETLLAQLSLAEKIAMLHQHAPAIERLSVAAFRTGTEAAHGVAWLGKATVFPQPVGLAASWDESLLRRVGTAIGAEVRGKHAADATVSLNVWAPVVNPLRHPLWGRNEEGFSEDPVLTGQLAAAFCRGLRGGHERVWQTVPTLKHFLGYNNEADRNVSSSQLRPRVLHEYELPAYSIPVADGAVGAVMLSYNLVNGMPAHVSDLVARHLRRWDGGAELVVVSDAGAPSSLVTAEKYFPDAVQAHAAALRAGVDNFTDDGADPAPTIRHLSAALAQGLITEAEIDASVRRLLRLRAATGEFDATAPGTEATPDLAAHRALAREAVAKGVVLLRNASPPRSGPLLPLAQDPGAVAVIGELGGRVLTDWYSGTPEYAVSVAQGLRERFERVTAVPGHDLLALRCVRTDSYLGSAGATESWTASSPTVGAPELFELQEWGGGEVTLRSTANGKLLAAADNGYIYPTAERIGGWVVQETFRLHPAPGGAVRVQHVGTGKWVHVEAHTGSALLLAGTPETAELFTARLQEHGLQAAARAARAAATAIVVVGNDPHVGGRETLDRASLELSQRDRELIKVVWEANPRTVLVIVSSYPYALGALAGLPAIVWTSHAGQELGHGLADVLSGAMEPYGRLPQTWFARDADLPPVLDYDIISARATYQYSRAEPLFALGHGLSYSRLEYQDLDVSLGAADTLEVSVTVRNTGARTATDVVQIYAAAPDHPCDFPRRLLVGHQRVHLAAGAEERVRLTVATARLATFSVTAERMLCEPGEYVLFAGRSAADLPVSATLRLDGPGSPDREPGQWVRAELFDAAEGLELVPAQRLAGTAVTVAAGSRTASARYRHWADLPSGPGTVRICRSAGGELAFETAGPAGSWRAWGTLSVPAGSSGDLRLTLPAPPRDAVAELRLVITGAVTVESFRLGG